MTTQHTPGPWAISKSSHHFMIYSEEGNGDTLALTYSTKEDSEQEANARLIAAAPELLQALIKANEIIDRLSSEYASIANRHSSHTRGEARIIEDAIRKATQE